MDILCDHFLPASGLPIDQDGAVVSGVDGSLFFGLHERRAISEQIGKRMPGNEPFQQDILSCLVFQFLDLGYFFDGNDAAPALCGG